MVVGTVSSRSLMLWEVADNTENRYCAVEILVVHCFSDKTWLKCLQIKIMTLMVFLVLNIECDWERETMGWVFPPNYKRRKSN